MTAAVRLATRGSALALAQSGLVAARLQELTGIPVELVRVSTHGDTDRRPLTDIGGTGVFVGAVRAAVLDGGAELAVHSFKDLPTAPPAGLVLAAVPLREDPADALVTADGRGLDELADGARIGTGSPRRAAQLAAHARRLGREWTVVALRGNVDTRLARVGDGLDAVVLAAAGLARLGRAADVARVIPAEVMLPAPAQGALAVESAPGLPGWLAQALGGLDDADSRAAATAERAVLAELGAGCSAPVGALARVERTGGRDGGQSSGQSTGQDGGRIALDALAATHDGAQVWRSHEVGGGADPRAVGVAAARALLAGGAGALPAIAAGAA